LFELQVSEKKSGSGSLSVDKTTEKLKESRMKKPDLMLKRKAPEPEEEKAQVSNHSNDKLNNFSENTKRSCTFFVYE
jgi:hypothetical protein